MQKKILFLVNSLGQGSGVMSFTMNYYKEIHSEKYQIDFIYCTEVEKSFKEELEKSGSKLYFIKRFKTNSVKDYIRFKKDIKTFFQKHSDYYDVIHSHVPLFTKYFFIEAQKYGLKARIIHSHSIEQSNSTLKKIRNNFILKNVFKYTNGYMACSEQAAISLYGKERTKNEVTIIRNAIDTKKFKFNLNDRNQIRRAFNVYDKFLILHVGRLSIEKNHMYMISIMKELIKKDNNYLMMFVGQGDLYENLYQKVKEEKMENYIIFAGIRKDVHKIMSAADCFILPSKHEGLGIVTIEAQANNLPCIVSENVPHEIDLTPLVHRLPIGDKHEQWVDKIISFNHKNMRERHLESMISEGKYDIKLNADLLGIEYEKIISSNRQV